MRTLMALVVAVLALAGGPLTAQSGTDLFQKALAAERGDGNLREAIQLYERVVKEFPRDRALVARALVRIAECSEKLGQDGAARIYERVVREFADQSESATLARARLTAMQAPAVPATQTVRQVWSGADVDSMGQPSADGRYLSFTDWSTGDLAVRDIVDGTSSRVTNTGGWDASGDFAESSVMAPDGRSVAYAWFTDKGGDPNATCECRYDLRLVATSGPQRGTARILHRSAETSWIAPTGWTPDGRQLLVARQVRSERIEIGLISVSDGTLRVLTPAPLLDADNPRLSPDGRFVAHEIPQSNNMAIHDIQILPVDGSAPWTLVEHAAHDRAPVFSIDGSQVLFVSDRTGEDVLWRVPINRAGKPTGPPVAVMAGLGANSWIMGTTRSGALFFSSGGPTSNVYSADLDGDYRATGPPALAVESFFNANSNPSLSPDGASIAFLSRRGARQGMRLLVRSIRGGQTREVTLPWVPADRVAWFPDGESLLVATVEERHQAYYRVSLSSGDVTRVFTTRTRPLPARSPVLSPDGLTVFYADQDIGTIGAGASHIGRFDLAASRQTVIKRVTGQGQALGAFQVSPDGKELAYLRLDGPARTSILEVMNVDGSNVRELCRVRDSGPNRFAGLAWTPDQSYVVFPRPVDDTAPASMLWRVRVTGGEPEPVGARMPGGIRLSEIRGRKVFFSAVDGMSSLAISVLEHYLPR